MSGASFIYFRSWSARAGLRASSGRLAGRARPASPRGANYRAHGAPSRAEQSRRARWFHLFIGLCLLAELRQQQQQRSGDVAKSELVCSCCRRELRVCTPRREIMSRPQMWARVCARARLCVCAPPAAVGSCLELGGERAAPSTGDRPGRLNSNQSISARARQDNKGRMQIYMCVRARADWPYLLGVELAPRPASGLINGPIRRRSRLLLFHRSV